MVFLSCRPFQTIYYATKYGNTDLENSISVLKFTTINFEAGSYIIVDSRNIQVEWNIQVQLMYYDIKSGSSYK